MTRVDFYIVDGAARHDVALCRIVEKACTRGHAVFVACKDADAVSAFNDLLWRFSDTSFVPHRIASEEDDGSAVVIGTRTDQLLEPDVLVNLAPDVPGNVSSFKRVVESAGFDDATREAARKRYRFYQERGFPLQAHKIGT